MNTKRLAMTLISSLLIFFNCLGFPAFAETPLPPGAVKGLPERLAALDDAGNAVNSATGEYFFRVEGMQYGETYTKNVQLINLRDDASYHIYFYVQPLFKAGDIDLEAGCECRFYLDGNEFYRGTVNGDGNIDLKNEHFDCGHYAPGETHTIRCEVIWNDLDVLNNVDNGWRLVDKDGVHVLVGPSGTGHVEGEIEFKWIFYAMADNEPPHDDSSDTPPPGELTTGNGGGESGSDSGGGSGNGSGDGSGNGNGDSSLSTDSGSPTPPPSDSSRPDDGFFPPYTGFLMKDGKFWLISMGVIALMIGVLLVLIKKQKKDKKK